MAVIQFQHVDRVFHQNGKDFVALKGINLEVKDREFVENTVPKARGVALGTRAARVEFGPEGEGGGARRRKPRTRRGGDFATVPIEPQHRAIEGEGHELPLADGQRFRVAHANFVGFLARRVPGQSGHTPLRHPVGPVSDLMPVTGIEARLVHHRHRSRSAARSRTGYAAG